MSSPLPSFKVSAKQTVYFEATIQAIDEKSALKAAKAVWGTDRDLAWTETKRDALKIMDIKNDPF